MAKLARPVVAGTLIDEPNITPEELQLAVRNHSMPLEALRYDITPLGLHYLLIHFDIPAIDPATWRLQIGDAWFTLDELKARDRLTLPVTLECAGNGRALLEGERAQSQPWLIEAVGTAEWTGTRLGPLLAEAHPHDRAVEVVFTGIDRGVQGGIEQQYERSLSVADAMRDEVLLVWAINGEPLTPQHGFPLRLIVPGWYGMTQVRWLRSITVLDRAFEGFQQASAYHYRREQGEAGEPVTRMRPAIRSPPMRIGTWKAWRTTRSSGCG